MPQSDEKERFSKLVGIIQQALQRDEQLRKTYQVGEKFGFIRERLNNLLENIQKDTFIPEKKVKPAYEVMVEEDEMLVYVHLYNSQGNVVRTWQSVITPKAFFDFSVNRPVYADQKSIETFIRGKANKTQHAYLTIAMKKEHLVSNRDEGLKDAMGNPLIKIKEGSLRMDKVLSFTHNENVYTLNEDGVLIKK